jgi:hypothetical protein
VGLWDVQTVLGVSYFILFYFPALTYLLGLYMRRGWIFNSKPKALIFLARPRPDRGY